MRFVLLGMLVAALPAQAAVHVEVHVAGINDTLKANVLATLGIVQYKNLGDQPIATIRRLYTEAPSEIRDALKPFGYFSPHIDSRLTHSGDTWTATYRIDPGKQVRFTKIDVKVTGPGADDAQLEQLANHPSIHKGEPFDQQAYSETKQQLQETAARRGYLDAHFTRHELRVDPEALSAEVELTFATGTRYRFGGITIHQKILKPAFVQRYVHIKPGDPYDAQALAALQSALDSSGYFSSVVVNPEKSQAHNHRVPVEVTTTPARRNRYTVGLGYGTDTGPRMRFDWENRRVNSKGHRFRFDSRFSRIETQAVARYIVPLQNPETDHIIYSATLNQQDFGDTVSHLFGAGFNRVSLYGGWQESLSLDANRYTSTIGAEQWTSRMLIPGVHFSRISAQPPEYPQHGYSINADISGGAHVLASDQSFLRIHVSARLIVPLGPGRLLLHGEAGAIAASNFPHLPVALRFYAGGDNSVRGYAYQSIGPRNANGQVVGGRYLKLASVEYDFPLVGNWGLAGFIDAGNASDDINARWNEGIGIGVRYRTPVGAVRLDLAHPVSHPQLGFYRIHLSIGLAL